ncbi:MAG: beta-ketoacyl synthase N-terminal-like domain-containing protein, partial [Acidimicrobiales bacterium]
MHEIGLDVMVVSPAGLPDARLAIGGSRAGAVGLVDLEFAAGRDAAVAAFARLADLGRGRIGVLVAEQALLDAVLDQPVRSPDVVVLAGGFDPDRAGGVVEALHGRGIAVLGVVRSVAEALAAESAGVDAVIAKGHEAGGWVGEEGSFVLLQRLLACVRTPVWVQGGVGVHTAAACLAGGAAGVVLDNQLLLARESPLAGAAKAQVEAMDGSETVCLGMPAPGRVRMYQRPGLEPVAELRRMAEGGVDAASWRDEVRRRVDWQARPGAVLAIGQDASFAADLARRFTTVGGIVAAVQEAALDGCRTAARHDPLAEGAPWAAAHGVRYPIAQGPMTRVSDRAEFAEAVVAGGGLPFLALALMRAPEVEALLRATQERLRDRPWGVGILGFVPPELRAEQLAVIRSFRPTFALIAGGRPDQAAALEAQGIPTYLHVPSPGLLKLYLKDGARRFVFEGRECGGHVGPRTSFVLWETMVRTLLDELPPGAAADYDVLFAGGIHDARSAAMVAAAAAPLAAQRGVRVGVLLGTAYLFTEEAVGAGAITEGFQQAAVDCDDTVLLETGPGHATRCLPSPYISHFFEEQGRLRREGLGAEDVRNHLEMLNIGRLRIAAKGVDRNPASAAADPAAPKLVAVDGTEQWRQGMYMIGQVAALRNGVCTIAQLHDEVSAGSSRRLSALGLPDAVDPEAAVASTLPPADIAIVGLGAILPGASDVRSFWANIVGKVDAVTEIPATRWDWRAYYDPDPSARDKVYSRWGGFVDAVPFEPMAFGMPPSTLRSIEPFQLLGLLAAKAALDDAGVLGPANADSRARRARLRTSVFIGAGGGGADLGVGYTVRASLPKLFGDSATPLTDRLGEHLPEWTEDSFAGVLMNVAAGRIANRFDLGGTNMTVDAACASSLAAVTLAVRDLQTGMSDMAVVGGVDAIQNPFAFLCFSKTHALSPTGRCRPFDATADGIAISEGFAAIVLKRREDAERDGDRIYAVIRGVGSASDGRDRSLTAPRPEGQMRALRRAYAHAQVSPADVGLVEAHGTGTVAGDRAEVEALTAVFADAGAGTQQCALGSVKSMIGHTKCAAGLAGMVKVALALHTKTLPPTLVEQPNEALGLKDSPLYLNRRARPWIHGDAHPRTAGVSAFGFGGTNFHAV